MSAFKILRGKPMKKRRLGTPVFMGRNFRTDLKEMGIHCVALALDRDLNLDFQQHIRAYQQLNNLFFSLYLNVSIYNKN